MNNKSFKERKKFSESSGVLTYFNTNINIKLNEFGYYEEYFIDESISDDQDFSMVPNFNTEFNEDKIAKNLFGDTNGIKYDPKLGYYKSLYVGHVIEDDYREIGSSGGFGTWILKELLVKGYIDGVIHVKKTIDSKILFEYQLSKTIDEIKEGSKTKYYPVELSKSLKDLKSLDGRYAVVGIPSFIMALRLLLLKDNDLNKKIIYTVGLICGHQKSTGFTESIAWQLGIEPDKIKDIDYRKKNFEKPASHYDVSIKGYSNGKYISKTKSAKEFLGANWGQGFFKVEASDYTDDVFNETADITLGDAWLPEYVTDSKGNNVIIVRNEKIDEVIRQAIENKLIKLDKVDASKIFQSQEAHYRHTHDELSYRLYLKSSNSLWAPKKRVVPSRKFSFLRKKIQIHRMNLSKKSHKYFYKAKELDDFDYFASKMSKLVKKYNQIYKIIYIKKLGLTGILKRIKNKIFKYKL